MINRCAGDSAGASVPSASFIYIANVFTTPSIWTLLAFYCNANAIVTYIQFIKCPCGTHVFNSILFENVFFVFTFRVLVRDLQNARIFYIFYMNIRTRTASDCAVLVEVVCIIK